MIAWSFSVDTRAVYMHINMYFFSFLYYMCKSLVLQGVYVVVDDRFKLLQNVSTSKQYVDDVMKVIIKNSFMCIVKCEHTCTQAHS